jgi:zinc protease
VIRRSLPGALALVLSLGSVAFGQGFPDEPFRATRPTAGAPHAFKQPPLVRFNLANGMEVVLIERHELPTVTMDISFPGGSITDPKGKTSLARVCTNLMAQGTEKLPKTAFDEAQQDIAVQVGASATQEELSVEVSALTKNLDAALDLWADMILHPGLRKEDLDRDVQRAIAGLAAARGAPAGIAGRVRNSVFYGQAHPYAKITNEADLQAITVDDCKKFVKDWVKPGGARLFVVGDITADEVKAKLTPRFKGWTGRVKPRTVVPALAPRNNGRIFLVDAPGSPQTIIFVAHPGPARQAKDYIPTSLAVDILGGMFTSRINLNLREDKGWTYGAGSGMAYLRTRGLFITSAQVKTDTTGGSIRELVKEITNMSASDVTDGELELAKGGAIQSLPARFATGEAIANSFNELIYFGLPLDYWAKYVPAVEKVNKASIRAASKAWFRPKDLVVLVVGDAKVIRPELDKIVAEKLLGAGGIVELDADGNVVPAK